MIFSGWGAVLAFAASVIVALRCPADQYDRISSGERSTATSSIAVMEAVVYKDLFEHHSSEGDKKFYTAYFLEADRQSAAYFSSLFNKFVPRVEIGTNNLLITSSGVIDKLTKRPGKLFWARVQSVSNDTADVEAGWYTGPQGQESILYHLNRFGKNWKIIKTSPITIS